MVLFLIIALLAYAFGEAVKTDINISFKMLGRNDFSLTFKPSTTIAGVKKSVADHLKVKDPRDVELLDGETSLDNVRQHVSTVCKSSQPVLRVKLRGSGGAAKGTKKEAGKTMTGKTFKIQAKMTQAMQDIQDKAKMVSVDVKQLREVQAVEADMNAFFNQVEVNVLAALETQAMKCDIEAIKNIQTIVSTGGNSDYKIQKFAKLFFGEAMNKVSHMADSLKAIEETTECIMLYSITKAISADPKYSLGSFGEMLEKVKNIKIGQAMVASSATASTASDGDGMTDSIVQGLESAN